MLFIKTRRELLEFLLNNRHLEINKITGKSTIKKYRELSDQIFCLDVFRDNCYEKYWLTGYEVGYKQASGGVDIPEISAPANALSRMCGEIALLYKEGYLNKIDRGLYAVTSIPVNFKVREDINMTDGTRIIADEVKKADRQVIKEFDLVKIVTEAATKAVQEALKK